jgi:hypothetical protein
MSIIIKSIICVGFTLLFVNSEPMILLKRLIGLKEERIGLNTYYDFICKLVYCNWCSSIYISFILTFISTGSIIESLSVVGVTSFIMWVIENKL